MFSNVKKKSGFTMVDLLIWLAIFGILTGTMVANFRVGANNDAIRSAAELAAASLREAQTKTLTGVLLPNSDFPDGGYGVRFDSDFPGRIIIFADDSLPSNYRYDAGEEIENGIIELTRGAQLSWPEEELSWDVIFSPPDGKIYFNGQTSPGKLTFTVSSDIASIQKQVEILRLSGQIRAQ